MGPVDRAGGVVAAGGAGEPFIINVFYSLGTQLQDKLFSKTNQ